MPAGIDGALNQRLVRLRRAVHRHPEIGLNLPITQARILEELGGLDLDIRTGRALSSVAAVLHGTGNAAPVLLRADMDALPLDELTDLEFASAVPGAAHACGHDLHVAMLVGVAHLLSARQHELQHDVVLMFQPGEEGHDGARLMLDEGLLEATGQRPRAAFALHVSSREQLGMFEVRSGPAFAGSAALTVTFNGRGGHGAWPHHTADPIPALADVIGALQTMITRRFDALDSVVLSVGVLRAGTAANIVPESAMFAATIRASTDEVVTRVVDESRRFCVGIAAAYGLTARVEIDSRYPATVNDPYETEFAHGLLTDLFGADRVATADKPSMVSDDIGRVFAAVPGTMVTLGARPVTIEAGDAAENHSPHAQFDDSALADGVLALTELAIRRIATI
jgi:amidohydrolase